NTVHDADGKGRDLEESLLAVVNETAGTAARDEEIFRGNLSSQALHQAAKLRAHLAGIQPHLRFADGYIIGPRIFGDGVEPFIAGVGLRVDGQKFGVVADQLDAALPD